MAMTLDGSNGVTFNDSSLQGAAASPYVLKNRIINGDMRIDQRNAGASLTITANPQYTVDRWFAGVTNASKISVQQSSTAPSGFTKSMLITSLAATTPSTSEIYYMQQSIEGFNVADLDFGLSTAKTITLSFWVRSSLTGTFGAVLLNAGSNRSFPFNYTISSANTWTQITQTITGDTTGTWATDNTTGFQLRFGLGAGSTYQGVAGSWGTTNAVTTTTATNFVGTNGATLYITGVQLEIGSTATPFERRLYNQELANCQRYYQYFGGENAYNYFGGTASITSTTNAFLSILFMTQMRSAPSFTYVGALSTFDLRSSGNASHTPSALAQDITTSKVFGLQITSSGLTANTPGIMIGANSTAGQLCFSAEL
jgi:hypothetical protein